MADTKSAEEPVGGLDSLVLLFSLAELSLLVIHLHYNNAMLSASTSVVLEKTFPNSLDSVFIKK